MRKVLSVITCSVLAACSCNENQWEEVDVVNFDDAPVVEEKVVVDENSTTVIPARVIVEQEAVYTPAPQPVSYGCPCSVQVQTTCCQPTCYQPCPCMQPVPQPAPQPKITTTKKVITTTTTIEEPCGKPVCEPVVTTHEEVLPAEVSYNDYTSPVETTAPKEDFVKVTVEKNPYQSQVIDMRSSDSKIESKATVKYSPEAYDVVATRATNRMLQDTSAIYDNAHKTLYLKETKLLSSDLPYGSNRLRSTTKEIISGSKTYDLVNNSKAADFIIDSSADWYVTEGSMPALQYKISLFDKSGRKVNEWVEIIRQVQE